MKKALFLHIQKTAGSSIINIARKYYGDNMTSYGDCWGHKPTEFINTAFVSGHIGYDYARSLMPSRFVFTFLRNPIERVLSLYYFCRKMNPDDFLIYRRAHDLSLEQFLAASYTDPLIKKNIWNNQVWQLAHGYAHLDERKIDDFSSDELVTLAMTHLDEMSYVGLTETFKNDRDYILSSLGLPIPKNNIFVNTNTGRPTTNDMSPGIKELLMSITSLDQILYDKVCSLRILQK